MPLSLPPAHAPLSPPSQVTRDHKPDDEVEQARIVAAGGSVQQKTRMLPGCMCISPPREVPIGPHRVVPGGLAVARSMGDVLLKYVLPSCSVFILVVRIGPISIQLHPNFSLFFFQGAR